MNCNNFKGGKRREQEGRRGETVIMFEQSLDHIHNRKMLDSLPSVEGEVGKGSVASDGETSDYQRSTPSPQDGNAMFPELGEGLEKAGNCSLGLPPSATTCSVTGTEWKANVSPDLGFEDYLDSGSNNGRLSICSSSIMGFESRKEDLNVKNMLLTQTNSVNDLQSQLNSRLSLLDCQNIGVPSRRFTIESDNHKDGAIVPQESRFESSKEISTAKILLNKQLCVEIEKLPSVMTTMVPNRKRRASFQSEPGGSQSTRKRYSVGNSSSSNNTRAVVQRPTSKKCPSYPVADHRTTNKIASRGNKEISISQPRLLNSFRITKPNKPVSHLTKEEASLASLQSFSSRSFYKQAGSSVKHCDLISEPPASQSISRNLENKQVSFCENKHFVPQTLPSLPSRDNTIPQKGGSLIGDTLGQLCDPRSQITVSDIKVGSENCLLSQELLTKESENKESVEEIPVLPRGFRYPTVQARPSAITCKWDNCGATYKSNGQLYDHLKTEHVSSQLGSGECAKFSCLWLGCKVYGKESSSKCWLEKHVPHHGGKFAYPCIVESCKMRFSSQVMLERHVNSHFKDKSNDSSNSKNSNGSSSCNPARKSIEGAPAVKKLKQAGVKIKNRELQFSARIFDFFDTGIMAGIRHQVVAMDEKSRTEFNMRNDSIEFTSKAISIRKDRDGRREVRLKWIPENLLPDEWVPLQGAPPVKTVKVCNLPEAAKVHLQHELLFKPQKPKQSRKTKRVEPPTTFLSTGESSSSSGSSSSHPGASWFS